MSSTVPNQVIAVVLALTLIAGTAVFLRLLIRAVVVRKFALEDGLIGVAMVLAITVSILIAEQIHFGMGQHIFDLSPQNVTDTLKFFWATNWVNNLALTCTKLSILAQYLRIFTTRRTQIACWTVLGLSVAYGLWTFFGSLFLCTPIDMFWDLRITSGHCLDRETVFFVNGGLNLLQNVAVLLLPAPVVWKLDLPKAQKRALVGFFGMGLIVCIVSAARLEAIISVMHSSDPTFASPPTATLMVLETNGAITIASLPSLRPLVCRMMPSYFPGPKPNPGHDEEKTLIQDTKTPYPAQSLRSPFTGTPDLKSPYSAHSLRASYSVAELSPAAPGRSNRVSRASTKHSAHSRSNSTSSNASAVSAEVMNLYMYDRQATIAGTGQLVNGPPRQVHIRTGSRASSMLMLGTHLPPLAEPQPRTQRPGDDNRAMSFFQGPLFPAPLVIDKPDSPRPGTGSSASGGYQRAKTRSAQKPLPITPFPVAMA